MKAKNAKPAAKKPTAKKLSAIKSRAITLSAGACEARTGKSAAKPAAKLGRVRVTAAKRVPQLLPIQPPTFEPQFRTAAQLRAAVKAVLR